MNVMRAYLRSHFHGSKSMLVKLGRTIKLAAQIFGDMSEPALICEMRYCLLIGTSHVQWWGNTTFLHGFNPYSYQQILSLSLPRKVMISSASCIRGFTNSGHVRKERNSVKWNPA